MSGPDLNLLFGMLALQLDFITRDQLIAAMQAWVLDKARPLGDILREQGVLAPERQQLLSALVQEHLRNHGNDPQKSLAALSSGGTATQALRNVQDSELEASLAHVGIADGDGRGNPATISHVSDSTDAARFRVIRRHAEGGLGIVYLARDMEVGRVVALKEIKPQHVENPNSRSRFVLEAEITGGLEHPGIVPVYGLGHYADGRPYYAMRFIKGDSLKDAIEAFHAADAPRPDGKTRDATERDLALRRLLRRFIDVCNAIDYAHSKGVLHRDLKPGNIMLGKYGETLVVDWGLAKAGAKPDSATARTLDTSEAPLEPSSGSGVAATQMGSAIGTPPFMSPEQAAGRLDLLGPASDVYSLGATLYSLLTGELAFPQKDIVELFKSIEKGTFRRPREVKPAIDPGLEAVCLKAMAREPGNRYPSAAALRKDLENWIADAPVEARPDPLGVKIRRWVGRHKVLAATSLASLVLLAAFLGVLAYVTGKANDDLADLAEKERTQKNAAIEQSKIAREQTEFAKIQTQLAKTQTELAQKRADDLEAQSRRLSIATGFASDSAWENRLVEKADETLDQIPENLRGWDWHYRKRHFQGSYITLHGQTRGASFSPDGERIVSVCGDGTLKVWDVGTGAEVLTLRGHTAPVSSASFSPDGQRIVSASDDKTVKIWDARTGTEVFTLRGHTSQVKSASFSPDGQRIVSGSFDETLKIWDARTGTEVLTLRGLTNLVSSASYSPDGQRIVSACWGGTLRIWDARTGAEVLTLRGHTSQVNSASYSPDGQRIVSASDDKTVKIWDARTGAEALTLRGHMAPVSSASYSPDGQRIVSGSFDKTLKIWDARTGAEGLTLRGHTDPVFSASFSPDGQRIVSGSFDKTLKIWDARTGRRSLPCAGTRTLCSRPRSVPTANASSAEVLTRR